MRHIFVVNPAAGQAGEHKNFLARLRDFADSRMEKIEIYVTEGRGDAEVIVRAICNESKSSCGNGEALGCGGAPAGAEVKRFYACGGDGTLNEVVNGAYGFSDVEVACVPTGTGNDFVRNFDRSKECFLDFAAQLAGKAQAVDLIRYTEGTGAEARIRYGINMFNIGFDCNVVDLTAELKKKPFLSGSLAYLTGVAVMLFKKKGANLDIFLDDGTEERGELLLAAVANGCFCGGGVKGIPRSDVSDGLMDVSIIKNMSRRTFVKLFPKYAKGTHLEVPGVEKLITYKKCRFAVIRPREGSMRLCADGEITTTGEIKFEIVPGALSFSVPAI